MPFTLKEAEATFPGRVHWVDDDVVLASRGRCIFVSRDRGETWKNLCAIPLPLLKRIRSAFKLSRRLLRFDVEHVARLGEDFLFLAFREIWIYRGDSRTIEKAQHSIVGSRPLNLCRVDDRHLYYGEYRGNLERSPVHVWGSKDGGIHWKPAHEFTTVRHVHGVYKDPYSESIWITTGDYDNECYLWKTDDQFASVDRVLGGSQQERCTTLLFTADHVYYGTDSPLEQNYLYRFSRDSLEVERLQSVGGPILQGYQAGGTLLFSTDCEPTDVNYSGVSEVWYSNNGKDWKTLATFPKDIWHLKYFQYGQVKFPAGVSADNYVWITPYAVKYDQTSLKIDTSQR